MIPTLIPKHINQEHMQAKFEIEIKKHQNLSRNCWVIQTYQSRTQPTKFEIEINKTPKPIKKLLGHTNNDTRIKQTMGKQSLKSYKHINQESTIEIHINPN
jgi:hypothetical protein